MARAVIITSYLEYPVDLPSLLRQDDYVVCLDGGYDIAQRLAITPDLLLGDFDSIRVPLPEDPAGQGLQILRYPPEKDYTELELAFRILDPSKTPDLLVIGGLGGRLDQTLVNTQMLQQYTAAPEEVPVRDDAESGRTLMCEPSPEGYDYGSPRTFRSIEILDGRNRCYVVHGSGPAAHTVHTIPREPGCYLSLLPLTEECAGVSLAGVKYPLENAVLRRGTSRSTSNEFRAEQALLQLDSGSLLVVVAKA